MLHVINNPLLLQNTSQIVYSNYDDSDLIRKITYGEEQLFFKTYTKTEFLVQL